MAKAISGIDIIDVDTAASNASMILDRISNVAATLATPAYDNEVSYRPAAQQWTVCTP